MNRRGDAGFTLVETLVALAVLAMAAMALLGATQAHIRNIAALEARAAAQWAAENHLAELVIGAKPQAGVAFLRCSGRGDDLGAEGLGELDRRGADA